MLIFLGPLLAGALERALFAAAAAAAVKLVDDLFDD